MDAITAITIVGTGIGVVAGCVQVADYMEKKREARRAALTPAPPPAAVPPPPVLPAPDLPHGTVTFLLTDLEDSSRLWQEQPDAMRLALARHDALVREAIAGHGGHFVKGTGDGILAGFSSASDAAQAAGEAQCALRAETWAIPMRARMALHTGVAEERDGDYFGATVNRVARLLAAGHGGQTLLSQATADLLRDHLPSPLSLTPIGTVRLRDLSRPEPVFQLGHPNWPGTFPALRALETQPTNLPPEVTSFVGRERETADVRALLNGTRLLTLTGVGGTGKTRLSVHVAAEMLAGDGDGVWLVELAPVTDPARVAQAVAGVLGVQEEAGKPRLQTLIDYLADKQALLLLDNCEHLLDACALLADALLKACPSVRLLASSREPLGVAGETVYRVPSLSLPDPKGTRGASDLASSEAARLFVERARLARPDFALTDANAPAVAQVCARLDGIPLALELAAARARALPVEQIAARLDDSFRLLTGGARTALPRQQTLRALIDWSYDLLSDAEKVVLSRLSVFAGGWTLEAAEAVCAGEGAAEEDVLDILTSLVDKSLVVYEEGAGSARYRLLETLRQYGQERLRLAGGEAALRARHRDYFLLLAEDAEAQLTGPEQARWLERLETEHDNLRAALAWSAAVPSGECLRLCGALWRFWATRGYGREGGEHLRAALEQGQADAPPAARAKALYGAGILAWRQCEYVSARALMEESLALSRAMNDAPGIAAALNSLGLVATDVGDYDSARILLTESRARHQQAGNARGVALALMNLGNVLSAQAEYAGARALYEESLPLFQQAGDTGQVALALVNSGNAATETGDYLAARSLFAQSLPLCQELGDKRLTAYARLLDAEAVRHEGDYDEAQRLLCDGLTLCQEIGDKRVVAYGLEASGRLAAARGQPERAARLWGAAHALRDAICSPLPAADHARLEADTAALRPLLGERGFQVAWDAGGRLSAEQAVSEALDPAGASSA